MLYMCVCIYIYTHTHTHTHTHTQGAPLMAQSVKKKSPCNAADVGSISVLGRSPGGGNGNPPPEDMTKSQT